MKIKILLLVPALALAGCETLTKQTAKAPTPPPIEPAPAPVAGTDLDQNDAERVRMSESLKAYLVGRLVDPNDPDVMHEAHTVYRREAGSNWNLNPNAQTVVPLGPVLAVADPRRRLTFCQQSWSRKFQNKISSWPRLSSKTRRCRLNLSR